MTDKKIEGIYFERKSMTQGIGHTAKVAVNEIHYFATSPEEGKVSLEIVNFEGKATGICAEVIEQKDFFKRFKSCSFHDCKYKLVYMDPEQRKVEEKVIQGKEFLEKKNYLQAEKELESACQMDAKHIKAHYALGKVYLEKGEKEKAQQVFERLSQLDDLFAKENRRVFKELGVDLRKAKMSELAMSNYRKATKIYPNDNGLYYGLARVYGALPEYDKAVKCLKKCLSLKPDHEKASQYLEHVEKKRRG